MAFDTYANLQTEIIGWANRIGDDEFASKVPGFITLAESMFNYGTGELPQLRVKEMEATTTITTTSGVGSLPTDYLEYREVKNAQGTVLTPTVPSSADHRFQYYPQTRSQEFAIEGLNIKTYSKTDEVLTFSYFQKIPALSNTTTSNWLLAKQPMMYLYGSLVFAATYMEDDQSIQRYGTLYANAVNGLINADLRGKYIRGVSRSHMRAGMP